MARMLLGVLVSCFLSVSLLNAQCPKPTVKQCPTFSNGCPVPWSSGTCSVPIDWFYKYNKCTETLPAHPAITLSIAGNNKLALTQPQDSVFPDFKISFSKYPNRCSGNPTPASGAFTPAPGDNFNTFATQHAAVAAQSGCYKLKFTYQSGGMTCVIDPHIIVGQ